MSRKSKIEWCDATWNVLTGCTKVSAGCKNCYAEQLHNMRHKAHLAGKHLPAQYRYPFEVVQMLPERLDDPLHWRKPARVFVNSMSDLFHKDVSFDFFYQVFARMIAADHHTFMVLTKRPARMKEFVDRVYELNPAAVGNPGGWGSNIWFGVSVENQAAADERIPLLLQTPAAVRFVSCEPLLGPVDLGWINHQNIVLINSLNGECGFPIPHADGPAKIDWCIVGGESGPNARPMNPDWARSLRDQCQAAGVPYFHKQNGEWAVSPNKTFTTPQAGMTGPWTDGHGNKTYMIGDGVSAEHTVLERVGKKAAGRLLDGCVWDEYPEAR